MESIALSCKNISLSLSEEPILENINLNLARGELHLLMGENGTGKTSIVNILSGVYPHGSYAGEVRLNDEALRLRNPRDAYKKRIVTLHQDHCLFEDLTIAENLYANLPAASCPKTFLSLEKKIRMADAFLSGCGLDIDSSRRVSQCSIVTKRTIELARLYLQDPEILILDEPIAVTDSRLTNLFLSLVTHFKERGAAILCISHDYQAFLHLIDRFSVLHGKQLACTMDREQYQAANKETLLLGDLCQSRYPKIDVKKGAEVLCAEHVSNGSSLKDISFALHKGEILGIFGQTGSGKSALSKLLFGMEPLQNGTIYIDRLPARINCPNDAISLGLAYITDERIEYGLFENLDSLENVYSVKENSFGSFWRRTQFEYSRYYRYAEKLNMSTPPGKIPRHLSGGEQQKLILMRWIMSTARIFIFNEPTQSIDIPSRVDVYNLFNDLVLKGCSVLLFSSNLEELLGMCDRILFISHGTVSGEISHDEGMQHLHDFV